MIDSPLTREVYPDGPVSIPGVRMHSIGTQYDQIVTPFIRQFYGEDVTNIDLQDGAR